MRALSRFAALSAALAVAGLAGPALAADPVNITHDSPSITVATPDGPAVISRNQDPDAKLEGDWARTSRACPPFCIQPISPAEGVRTIGELELIGMLGNPEVVVIDSRTPSWFEGGSIPGAVNMPYTEMADELDKLGCEVDFDGFLCEEAPEIALFCNGPWCGQSPTAIRRIISAGYPAEKISYYRGGMQVWRMLGFNVTE